MLGVGFSDAFDLLVPATASGGGWRLAASLRIEGIETSRWTGYSCLTGSGRYAGVVFAPVEFTNDPVLRDRGAFAATVDLQTGKTWLVPERVSLKYHTPGCGVGDQIVFQRSLGADQAATELLRVDPARRVILDRRTVRGQVTFEVPFGDGVAAAAASSVVDVSASGHTRVLAGADGVVMDVHPNAAGGLDFLVAHPSDRGLVAERWVPGSSPAQIGRGAFGALRIAPGRAGQNRLVGSTATSTAAPGVRLLAAPGIPRAVSLDGSLLVRGVHYEASPRGQLGDSIAIAVTATRSGARSIGKVTSASLSREVPSASAGPLGTYNVTTPTCAVAPIDYQVQVHQPTSVQAEWAANQAVRNKLTNQRPANWNNNGLPIYKPQVVFPAPWTTNPHPPVQVLLGVMAQESNFSQASWHALPGAAGDPLIADYYGTVYDGAGHIIGMDYDKADCGYGIGQITDHMTVGDTYYTSDQKTMIATDYEANIAVAVQTLENKWDQTQAAPYNLIANTGNKSKVENWYFALWAYNSGLHAQVGANPWGLGWTNNPANADYPIDRNGFLRDSYDDASHPGDWPYQEKVLGWAETAQLDYLGQPKYLPVSTQLVLLTDYFALCDPTDSCDPNYHNGSLSYCTRSDRECWWHGPKTWFPGGVVGTGEDASRFHLGDPEPPDDNPWPPDCDGSTSSVPTTPNLAHLPAGAKIVDDVPNRKWNIVGCSARANLGSFALNFNTDGSGAPLSRIDFHQIGAGYGGHTWFAHTVDPARTSMIVTGTWTPPSGTSGWTRVLVHIPSAGADTFQADYHIWTGTKSYHRVVNQRWNQDVWFDLGHFKLGAGSYVWMNNTTLDDWKLPQPTDIAYDAIAFVPATKPVVSYVALGDSYSAGEGLEPYDANSDNGASTPAYVNACHRSSQAYPPLTFTALTLRHPGTSEFHAIACSGATTDSILTETHWGEVPQVAQGYLDENTTNVSVGIGGNDAGFGAILLGCFWTIHNCLDPNFYLTRDGVVDPQPLIYWEPQVIAGIEQDMKDVLAVIRTAAPNATILVLGYPHVMSYCPEYTPAQVDWFNQMDDLLSSTLGDAAASQGALFVDPRSTFAGHEACTANEWINAFIAFSQSGSGFNIPGSGSFHPKAIGHVKEKGLVDGSFP